MLNELLQKIYEPVFTATGKLLAKHAHVMLGIDGMCAAGKTSLARLLALEFGGNVMHADDFFLQPHQRTAARLAQPGGNIDYERLALAAENAKKNSAFCYDVYSCNTQNFSGKKCFKKTNLTILEGTYSLHPKVGLTCQLRVFVSLSTLQQLERIKKRESPQQVQRFIDAWLPMEAKYFKVFEINKTCDIVLNTSII